MCVSNCYVLIKRDFTESSALQEKKLSAFLKSMQKKKGMLEELLQTCCQVSSHLSEAEGPVACFEPVRTLQERWQTLEGAASRSLWHANICTAEASTLLQEAGELRHKLEILEKSVSSSESSQGQLDFQYASKQAVKSADVEALKEHYLYLLEISQALSTSPLGRKELGDVEDAMQGLNSQLALTQEKLTSSSSDCSPIIRIIRDYFTWAKQTESRINRSKRLSLFPEEASHQVNHVKKLQSEISQKSTRLASVLKDLRQEVTGLSEADSIAMSPTLNSLEELYVNLSEKANSDVEEMNRLLHIRERLWKQITDSSSWLTSVLEKESGKSMASELKTTIPELRVKLQLCTEALKEAERQANNLQALLDETKSINQDLSVPETFHLFDKLTTLHEEVSKVVNRKWASHWVLEELLHAQESSAEEQNVIQKRLRQISADTMRQTYPVTRDSLLALEPVKHMLMELLCNVQENPHCPEHRRNELLHTILNLQSRIRLLDQQATEQKEYLSLRQQMEDSRKAMEKSQPRIGDTSIDANARLGFCQSLLVELPLVKLTCQEAADHLEAIAKDLYPSQLTAERQRIRRTVEQLASWEFTASNEAKTIGCCLMEGLSSSTELGAVSDLFNCVRQEMKETVLEPDNQAIDAELRKYWTLVRTVEFALQMLASCAREAKTENYKKTVGLGQTTLKDCHMHMVSLFSLMQSKSILYGIKATS